MDDLADLIALSAVAELRSFTRAALRLSISQSALSRTIRSLEERYGVTLLARTTRSVSATEAGQALLEAVRPSLEVIEDQLSHLERWRKRPVGRLRVSAARQAALTVLWPVLPKFLAENPEVEIEICAEGGAADLVSNRLDAGIQFGMDIDKDMVAIPIGRPMRAAVVAAPSYFALGSIPLTPSELLEHRCINYRMTDNGPSRPWRFSSDGMHRDIKVNGGLIFNDDQLVVNAALAGMGLAYVFEDQVADYIREGRLQRALEDWCAPFPGYHLYYPTRRQVRPALRRLIDVLKDAERTSSESDPTHLVNAHPIDVPARVVEAAASN
ncbi:LysR family transcriptional regulator [Xanthomonas sp. AmX2]|uniref:LysR family transcriptional regulator n=1 Tax=Xanthomonas sp. TaxID=29446 RepID=UPI001980095A|nr:LysR family transcriptional regulator [Xanthomonas sp.]MBN6152202.1 LysR family transcriptional regulator [Xanthomonas sp.]